MVQILPKERNKVFFSVKIDFAVWKQTFLITGEVPIAQSDGTWGCAEMEQHHVLGCQSSPGLAWNVKHQYFPKSFRFQTLIAQKTLFSAWKMFTESQTTNEWFISRLLLWTVLHSSPSAVSLCSSQEGSATPEPTCHPKGKPSNVTKSNVMMIMMMLAITKSLTKGLRASWWWNHWREM